MITNKIFRAPVKVRKIEGSYYVFMRTEIQVGEMCMDESGLIFFCTEKNRELLNSKDSNYWKLISKSNEDGNWVFNSGPPHDRNYNYQDQFAQPMTQDDYERIIETGGNSQIEIERDEFGIITGPAYFWKSLVFYTPMN